MGQIIILPETTKHPITLIGQRAGVCWGADTTDLAKNYQRGLDCIESGHGRTLEFVNVEMVLDGYSARVMREWYTHIGGAPTRLQASTRYIDYGEFEYVVPPSIEGKTAAKLWYIEAMDAIQNSIKRLEDKGIPREDAAMLLPLGMTTHVVDKRNLRNIIDMSRNRMCQRAFWEFRDLFSDLCSALVLYGHENGSNEWETIVTTQMWPKCEATQTCPEKRGCGRYPKEDRE